MSKLKPTRDHMDDLVKAHVQYRDKLGLVGVSPAYHHQAQYNSQFGAKTEGKQKEPKLYKGHCLNCKESKNFVPDKEHTTSKGMKQPHGKCPDCGGKVAGHFLKKGESVELVNGATS